MNKDLGLFIRKHRERASPEDAGIRRAGRRRTPGLRREELAQLCSVSPTWITWLEQGREVSASKSMLDKLSVALRLTPAERRYLFALAGRSETVEAEEGQEAVLESVKFMGCPAYFLDRLWNAVSWNEKAELLFEGWLDGKEKNLLKFVFTSSEARKLISNWEERAMRLVAEFRSDCGPRIDDLDVRQFVSGLSDSSPDFSRFWEAQDVTEREGGIREFDHPVQGRISYRQVTFLPATRRDLKLVILIPSSTPLP